VAKTQSVDVYFIHENLVEVDVMKDLFDIAKPCRESFYYLRSLKGILSGQVFLKEDEEKVTNLLKQITELELAFEHHDEAFCVSEIIEDQLIKYEPESFVEIEFVFNSIKSYIDLKSKMDKLQLIVLNYLIDTESRIMGLLVEEIPYLERVEGILKLNILFLSAFEHSAEEDRIVSYKLFSKNHEVRKDLRTIGIELPEIVKARDYSFQLNKKRSIFQKHHESFVDLILKLPELEEEKYLKEISKKQYSLNKQITILTYIVVLLTIFSIGTGLISAYYIIMDHSAQQVIEQTENNSNNN
jgi:hypothetical protein